MSAGRLLTEAGLHHEGLDRRIRIHQSAPGPRGVRGASEVHFWWLESALNAAGLRSGGGGEDGVSRFWPGLAAAPTGPAAESPGPWALVVWCRATPWLMPLPPCQARRGGFEVATGGGCGRGGGKGLVPKSAQALAAVPRACRWARIRVACGGEAAPWRDL
mmetsp:Transcript_10139/g.29103  ORF Transcript_10139/g.29103 Transcript_10139/m.29103 type:complete len:161 (+) Transcript_10139:212-694(+)